MESKVEWNGSTPDLGTGWFHSSVWLEGWSGSILVFGWKDGMDEIPDQLTPLNVGPTSHTDMCFFLLLVSMPPLHRPWCPHAPEEDGVSGAHLGRACSVMFLERARPIILKNIPLREPFHPPVLEPNNTKDRDAPSHSHASHQPNASFMSCMSREH